MSEHAQPKMFEITWDGWAYRVSVPNLLGEGERLKVVELEPMLDLLERLAATPKGDIQREYATWKQAADNACEFLQAHGRLS